MNNNNWRDKQRRRFVLNVTENQASIIVRALANESVNDMPQQGEYSYSRCYHDICRKLDDQGFWDSPEPKGGKNGF